MHKDELFFILIGLSPCFHLVSFLEKRVVSRLNAQCVYLRTAQPKDICQLLSAQLQINIDSSSSHHAYSSSLQLSSLSDSQIAAIEDYNRNIVELFGSAYDIVQSTKAHSGDDDEGTDAFTLTFTGNNQELPAGSVRAQGELFGLIECCLNWGRSAE